MDGVEAGGMLQAMCKEAQGGSMPMPSYTLVHRGAQLSETDIGTLCDWAGTESERLAAGAAPEIRALRPDIVE